MGGVVAFAIRDVRPVRFPGRAVHECVFVQIERDKKAVDFRTQDRIAFRVLRGA